MEECLSVPVNQRLGEHEALIHHTTGDSNNCEAVAACSLGPEWLVSLNTGGLEQREQLDCHTSKPGAVKNMRTNVPVRVNGANNVLVIVMICQLFLVRPICIDDIYLEFSTAMLIGMERKLFTVG